MPVVHAARPSRPRGHARPRAGVASPARTAWPVPVWKVSVPATVADDLEAKRDDGDTVAAIIARRTADLALVGPDPEHNGEEGSPEALPHSARCCRWPDETLVSSGHRLVFRPSRVIQFVYIRKRA